MEKFVLANTLNHSPLVRQEYADGVCRRFILWMFAKSLDEPCITISYRYAREVAHNVNSRKLKLDAPIMGTLP